MLVGAHESISGGVSKAISRAVDDECEAVQVFVKNSNRWVAKPLQPDEIEKFRQMTARSNITVCCHSSYLINMATVNSETRQKSFDSMCDELKRCDDLGIGYYIIHPGSHLGEGEDVGIKKIAEMLDDIYNQGFSAMTLLEITAGQGSNLGYRLEHLERIIQDSRYSDKIGVCLDSCHMYSAGFDIVEKYDEVFEEIFQKFPDKIKVFHLNDSKKPLASKLDRHEMLGKGIIGLDFFKKVVNDARFDKVLGILETPIGEKDTYLGEVKILKSLRGQNE